MPDELATRATLMLTLGILVCGGLAVLTSWVWRRVWSLASGVNGGLALGLALFAAGMLWVVWDMAQIAWQQRGHVLVQGELLGFDAITLRERSRGQRKLSGAGPVVEFKGADGQLHQIVGLSGSQAGRQPGDAVPVRLNPLDPEKSVIADFQHEGAALWLFGTIAAVAVLSALHSALQAVVELRPTLALPAAFVRWRDAPAGVRRHRLLGRLALATVVLSFLGVFVLAEVTDVGRALAAALGGVAVALLHAGIAALLEPGKGSPLALLRWLSGVVGMAGFAALVWAVTGG